ncbi:MAG TPA: hypothetical protein VMU75_10775 [Acidimicrobiales bacterium]|nr:hypothetical protein [Acidimicrobiales bacterium]
MAHGRLTERRWFPTSQPQTLQIAVALLYWNAFLSLIVGLVTGGLGRLTLLLLLLDLAGAFGIANERKWGYVTAIGAAFLPLVLLIAIGGFLGGGLLSLIFQIALIVLLLHPMSRNYYKIWFR